MLHHRRVLMLERRWQQRLLLINPQSSVHLDRGLRDHRSLPRGRERSLWHDLHWKGHEGSREGASGGRILACIYIYAVESNIGPILGSFWFKNWSKVASKIGPRLFCLLSPISKCFWYFQNHKKCVGMHSFLQFLGVAKKGFLKNVHFLFLSFYVGERKREKRRKKKRKDKKIEK